jgi:hypothetical protein
MASLIDVQRTHCSHPRSSTAPGLSMWRVDAKRVVSYSAASARRFSERPSSSHTSTSASASSSINVSS